MVSLRVFQGAPPPQHGRATDKDKDNECLRWSPRLTVPGRGWPSGVGGGGHFPLTLQLSPKYNEVLGLNRPVPSLRR